ncbi:MAG: hypothetical protein ACXVIS_07335 [Halobacteriota archaeon]
MPTASSTIIGALLSIGSFVSILREYVSPGANYPLARYAEDADLRSDRPIPSWTCSGRRYL